MRVLVCGGREYVDRARVYSELEALTQLHGCLHIIQGGARGADRLAADWAIHERPSGRLSNYPADWRSHGKGAGPIRNQQMLDEGKPDLVLAFRGGRGTADMISRARKAGVRVIEVT